MRDHKRKALILDSDPDALINLQRTLENGGVDTTITWDHREAQNLIRSTRFDVALIADHRPEIHAESTVREFRRHGVLSPVLDSASDRTRKEQKTTPATRSRRRGPETRS